MTTTPPSTDDDHSDSDSPSDQSGPGAERHPTGGPETRRHPTGGFTSEALRVLVVDDQPLMRSGFSMMLSAEEDIEVVGDAADGAAAIEACRQLRPDVVLMDVQMPGMDGIEATSRIVSEGLARVLILTTFDRDDYLFDALRAGAGGFLLKNSDPDDLVDGIRAIAHGHALLAPEVTRRVIEKMTASPGSVPGGGSAGNVVVDPLASSTPAPTAHTRATHPAGATTSPTAPDGGPGRGVAPTLDALTARELQVLRHVARGLSNAEIAAELVVGEATVKSHVSACLSKLHLRDRVQAVVLAYEAGLVHAGD